MSNQKYTAIGYPAPPPATGYPISEAEDDNDKFSSDTNPNPNHNPEAKNREIPKRVVVIINSIVILIFLLGITFTAVVSSIEVVWQPIDPDIRLTSLSLTGFNVSSFTVSGNWTASFTVFNNDKRRQISFSGLKGYVYYNYHVKFAAADSIPPLALEANSTADFSVAFVPTWPFLEGELLNRIVYDRSRGSIQFDVRIIGTAEFEARGRPISKTSQWYDVLCDDLPVEISSNSAAGEFASGSHNCNVHNQNFY